MILDPSNGVFHFACNPDSPWPSVTPAFANDPDDRPPRADGRLSGRENVRGDDEALIFTPAGFDRPGTPATIPANDPAAARLEIVVLDGERGRPTPCRVNVVGADGRSYQPAEDRLSPYGLTGIWPKTGHGNRPGKAPVA